MIYTDPIFSHADAVVLVLSIMGGSLIGIGLAAVAEWFVARGKR